MFIESYQKNKKINKDIINIPWSIIVKQENIIDKGRELTYYEFITFDAEKQWASCIKNHDISINPFPPRLESYFFYTFTMNL